MCHFFLLTWNTTPPAAWSSCRLEFPAMIDWCTLKSGAQITPNYIKVFFFLAI